MTELKNEIMAEPILEEEVVQVENQMHAVGILENEGMQMDEDQKIALKEFENRIIANNQQIDNMTPEELDAALKAEIPSDQYKKMVSENVDIDMRKDFLRFTRSQKMINDVQDNFQKEMHQLHSTLGQEMQAMLDKVNQLMTMDELKVKIEMAENEEEKKKYVQSYNTLYNSLYLKNIQDKINNKGKDVILKECNREYARLEQKVFKILKNDKSMVFLSPENLDRKVEFIVNIEYAEQVKPLLYTLFIIICKNKKLSKETALFVSFFLITVDKALKALQENAELDSNLTTFIASLEAVLKTLK